MDAAVLDEVHAAWFGPLADFRSFPEDRFPLWFQATPEMDAELRRCFGVALEAAIGGAFPEAALDARQQLGLILLLDQLSRNIHRGSPRAYEGDGRALEVARLVAAGGYAPYTLIERVFAILPFGHSEELGDQERALALFAEHVTPHADPEHFFYGAGQRQSLLYRDVIARFGRFPHRNEVLGRATTPEEAAFLNEVKMTPF